MGKPGPQCTICKSEHRAAIEVGLVHKVPARVLADRYGVSDDAIHRHGRSHLSPAQRAAILAHRKPTAIDLDQLRTTESEGILAQLVAQRARLQVNAELAAGLGDVKAAVSAESAITANLTLVAKLLGQLVTHHNVTTTSVLVSADYIVLRQSIIAALRPFPEAAAAVGAALARLEAKAATDIAAAARKPTLKTIEHEPAVPTLSALPPPPPY